MGPGSECGGDTKDKGTDNMQGVGREGGRGKGDRESMGVVRKGSTPHDLSWWLSGGQGGECPGQKVDRAASRPVHRAGTSHGTCGHKVERYLTVIGRRQPSF